MSESKSASSKLICYHCGLTCTDDSIAIGDKLFCCCGCKMAYEILENSGLGKYYDLNQTPGSIPAVFGNEKKYNF
ncbi:MAG: heavy metal translocating P-type ATPase metal-binding domain-containing protein, partial [Candidatus Marinimicrobia bacterium]|nr:heavy metal translocating P-type ATPase metal-binding domain-containing protein [Candidatus Neomarinimicrobiota bacterium]